MNNTRQHDCCYTDISAVHASVYFLPKYTSSWRNLFHPVSFYWAENWLVHTWALIFQAFLQPKKNKQTWITQGLTFFSFHWIKKKKQTSEKQRPVLLFAQFFLRLKGNRDFAGGVHTGNKVFHVWMWLSRAKLCVCKADFIWELTAFHGCRQQRDSGGEKWRS